MRLRTGVEAELTSMLVFSQRALFLLLVAVAPYAFNPWLTSLAGAGAVPILVPILAASVIGQRLFRGQALPFPRELVPAAFYVGVATISLLYAESTVDAALSVERATLRLLVFPYVGWLLMAALPRQAQARFLHQIVVTVMVVAFCGAVIAFVQFATKQWYWLPESGPFLLYRRDYMFRPIALTESPTTWGIFLLLPVFIALSQLAIRPTIWHTLSALFFLTALVTSGTRSAWVGALVAAIWLVVVRWRSARRWARITLTVSMPLIILLVLVGPVRESILERITMRSESLDARRSIYGAGLAIIAQHPLTGVGVGNFARYVADHPGIVSVGTVPYVVPEEGFQSHNTLLGIWAETGVFGFAAFLWLLTAGWQAFGVSARRLRAHPAGISPLLIDGLQAAYLAFLVASLGQRVDEYLFVWLVLATAIMGKESTRTLVAPAQRPAHA
jgi:O-antigen ligase